MSHDFSSPSPADSQSTASSVIPPVVHPPVLHGQSTQQPAQDAAITLQLAQLQQSVDALNKKVDTIKEEVAPDYSVHIPKTPQERWKAQVVAAGAGALLVGKLAGIIGAKYGVLDVVINSTPKGERQIGKIIRETFSGKNKGQQYIDAVIKWGSIGAAIGSIPGAILGFARGEKIGNPKMFWKHPIESFKILLGFSEGLPKHGAAASSDPTTAMLEASEQIAQSFSPGIGPNFSAASPSAAEPASDWQSRENARRDSHAQSSEAVLSH